MQIQVSNLNKSYFDGEGRKLHILRGLNFEAKSGSTVAIVGASGTGKSTFLHTIGTLESIDEGQLCLDGRDLTNLTRDQAAQFRNEKIGFIFQFHQLLQDFTALENVMIPQLIQGENVEVIQKNALDLLEKVGLSERAGHKPTQLSGGEQQRVAIARTLLKDPPIVILDEATSALDSRTEQEILATLNRVARGRTTLAIAHRLSTIADADRILVLEQGRLAEQGHHTDLLRRDGLYAEMWMRQQAEQVEATD